VSRVAAWLRRVPLQVKLVAAVLALVTVGLVVISVASTVALRSYLTNEIDEQLVETLERIETQGIPSETRTRTVLPTDFVLHWRLDDVAVMWRDQRYAAEDLPPPPTRTEAEEFAGQPRTVAAQNEALRWRMVTTSLPNGSVLMLAQDMSGVDRAVSRLIWIEVLVGAAVLVLAGALGAASVRFSLRPLVRIEHTAEAIASGDLTRRVPEPDPAAANTEVGRLATALNTMLAQIEAAFTDRAVSEERARHSEERMRQFVADASHELRTPLTTIRGFAELYRQGAARAPEHTGDLMRRIENEAARMGLLVEDLLLLARLDQERPLRHARVVLPVLLTDAVEAARAVAPERPIALEIPERADRIVVDGDEARLRQVYANLLGNALTHTPPGTPVTVRLHADGDTAVTEVVDEGPGLSTEQADRVFERFYRADTARGRPVTGRTESAGTGLGLAIVAALVAAHRGTVEVDSAPGRGATFRVTLPLADRAGSGDLQDAARRTEGLSGKV
jgi:two-component system, OmpR family, sensor kinase